MSEDAGTESKRQPVNCLGGIRYVGGVNLIQALVWNVRTCRSDDKGKTASGNPTRVKVPMQSTWTEQPVVVKKSL